MSCSLWPRQTVQYVHNYRLIPRWIRRVNRCHCRLRWQCPPPITSPQSLPASSSLLASYHWDLCTHTGTNCRSFYVVLAEVAEDSTVCAKPPTSVASLPSCASLTGSSSLMASASVPACASLPASVDQALLAYDTRSSPSPIRTSDGTETIVGTLASVL